MTEQDKKAQQDPGDATLAARTRRDAALILPIAGMVLLSPPVLEIFTPAAGDSGPYVAFYLFGLWVTLIFCAARLARRLSDG
jgi:hypothetical protein